MQQAIEAIYEHGTLRLLEPLHAQEGQRVRVIVLETLTPKQMTDLAASVYDGLPKEEIEEIEKIALDRSNFFGDRTLP